MQQFLLITLGGVSALLVCLSQVSLWQRKEYRFDRMKAHLLSPEGAPSKEWFVIVQGVFLLLAWMSRFELFAVASILSIVLGHSLRIYRKGVMRPDFTTRAILVFAATGIFGLVVFLLIVPFMINALFLATCIFVLPLLIALSVFVVGIPAQLQKQKTISRAKSFRAHLKNLAVVGITGSVGKTSTKTYLVHLLGGESETIVATSEHRNSPYSVAQDMLSRISQQTKIYIAEMGAYVSGEIKELADLTMPSVAVITAITNQHVALFGSLEALARTKWELVDSLPEHGVAILNKDDAQIIEQAIGFKKKMFWFSLHGQADVYTTDILMQQDCIVCTIHIGKEKQDVRLPVISRGQLVPVIAAVTAAHALGSDFLSIMKRLATLPQLPRTMEVCKGIAGSTLIDDSYSASEASVTNAIEYLRNSPITDTRLILVPIIELGDEGKVVHERIGALLANLPARVFIYGHAYKDDILRGLGSSKIATVTWHTDTQDMQQEIMKNVTSKTRIVLEGRIPKNIRTALL